MTRNCNIPTCDEVAEYSGRMPCGCNLLLCHDHAKGLRGPEDIGVNAHLSGCPVQKELVERCRGFDPVTLPLEYEGIKQTFMVGEMCEEQSWRFWEYDEVEAASRAEAVELTQGTTGDNPSGTFGESTYNNSGWAARPVPELRTDGLLEDEVKAATVDALSACDRDAEFIETIKHLHDLAESEDGCDNAKLWEFLYDLNEHLGGRSLVPPEKGES